MPHRPRILVSYSIDAVGAPEWFQKSLNSLARTATLALAAAGAETLLVDASRAEDDPKLLAASADGVVVLGGSDVDPALYGEQPHPTVKGTDARADGFEIALVNAAIDAGTPLLGICRGAQLLNVARGGTLVQHIDGDGHRVLGDGSRFATHPVSLTPGSRLGSMFGADALAVSSGHHQAVGGLGRGLRVSAMAPDGTIEAIEVERPDVWAVGVQWHPEDPDAHDPAQLATLAAEFVRVASETVSAAVPNG